MFIVGLRKVYSEINSSSPSSITDVFVYFNESIKIFETNADADNYYNYLSITSKYPKEYSPFLFSLKLYKEGELNTDDLLKDDVLLKLSVEEKRVLGL